MGRYCAAFGCKNNSKKLTNKEQRISFHSFPLQDPDRLKKWLSNLRRKDFEPTPYSSVCSEHFRESDFIYQQFTKTRLLKKSAIPMKISGKNKIESCMPTSGFKAESKNKTQTENKNKTQMQNKNKTSMNQVKKMKPFTLAREKICNKCGFVTFSVYVLYNHKYKCKGQLLGKPVFCTCCQRKFNFLNLYKNHKKTCVKKAIKEEFFKSKFEEKKFKTKKTPKTVSSDKYSFSCPICHATFQSKSDFVNHLKQPSCFTEQTVKKKSFSARKSFSSPKHAKPSEAHEKKSFPSKLKNEAQQSKSNQHHRCLWCKSVYPTEKLLFMHFEMNDQCAIAYYQKHCLNINQKIPSKARKSFSTKAKKSFPSKKFVPPSVSRSSLKFSVKSKTARKTLVAPSKRKDHSKSDKSFSKRNLNQCPVCFEDFPDTFTFYQHQKATNHWGKATKSFSSICRCPFCDKEFSHIKSRNAHVRNHSDRSEREILVFLKSITCSVCSQTFSSDSAKLQHMKIKHQENSASFIASNTESDNEESDRQKMSSVPSSVKKKLRQQPNSCPVCSMSFSHTVLRNKHFNEVHLKIFECQYCNTKFKSKSSLSNHIQLSHSKSLNCKGCKASFSNEIELLQHILKYHPGQDPKVLLPTKQVKTISSKEKFQDMADVPKMRHSENIKLSSSNSLEKNIEFYCDVCDIGYQKLCGLQRHRQSKLHKDTLEKNIDAFHKSLSELPSSSSPPVPRVVKQPEILTCSECSEEFTNIKDFVPHRLSHFSVQSKYLRINELNPYMCEICSDVMDSHSKVQLHLFWHLQVESTSNKNSLVPNKNDTIVPDRLSGQHVAKKSFSKPGNEPLQEVVIGGVSKPLFTCEACNIGFTTKMHYNIHVRKLCKKVKSAKLLAKYSSMKNDTDNESLGASDSGIVHCRKCNFLFSTEAKFEQHKEFCKTCDFDIEPEEMVINVDTVKSALGVDTAVAGCITCAALFDDISSIEGHLMTHQTGEVSEEVPDVLHCAFCNCLFSLDSFKTHKDFCKIHVNIGRKVTKSKHLDVLKSALELKCAVAACIACGLHFDDLETFSKHLMLHQTNQIQNDPVDKNICNGETSAVDKNIEDENSLIKTQADILTGDSVDDTDLNDQDHPEPTLDSMSGYSSDYSVDTENKKSSTQVVASNDKKTDSIEELRENFSQLLCLLISDTELMQKLGYGKFDVDDVLVNVLRQMGQKPCTENASKIELLRKNIKMLLNLCLKDQFLQAIGKGKTADEMVVEALNIFASEEMDFESD